MTGREALNRASRNLLDAGREDGERIAWLLLQEVLGVSATVLLTIMSREIQPDQVGTFESMIARATGGEPAQYIIGHWDFYGRMFKTDRRALIPRPETELLVEVALASIIKGEAMTVFDAGCGTGCIGITMKLECPAARVTLGDISGDALAIAAENAKLRGADVLLVDADMRQTLPGGPYDIIVSNPPYINTGDMETLSPVVLRHEPALALHGGPDGLDFIRALAGRAGDSLKVGGRMFIEVGYDQAEGVIDILWAAGMSAEALLDYSGILRVIAARKE